MTELTITFPDWFLNFLPVALVVWAVLTIINCVLRVVLFIQKRHYEQERQRIDDQLNEMLTSNPSRAK